MLIVPNKGGDKKRIHTWYQNLWDVAKTVLEEVYRIKKKEISQISNIALYFKELEKEE